MSSWFRGGRMYAFLLMQSTNHRIPSSTPSLQENELMPYPEQREVAQTRSKRKQPWPCSPASLSGANSCWKSAWRRAPPCIPGHPVCSQAPKAERPAGSRWLSFCRRSLSSPVFALDPTNQRCRLRRETPRNTTIRDLKLRCLQWEKTHFVPQGLQLWLAA